MCDDGVLFGFWNFWICELCFGKLVWELVKVIVLNLLLSVLVCEVVIFVIGLYFCLGYEFYVYVLVVE